MTKKIERTYEYLREAKTFWQNYMRERETNLQTQLLTLDRILDKYISTKESHKGFIQLIENSDKNILEITEAINGVYNVKNNITHRTYIYIAGIEQIKSSLRYTNNKLTKDITKIEKEINKQSKHNQSQLNELASYFDILENDRLILNDKKERVNYADYITSINTLNDKLVSVKKCVQSIRVHYKRKKQKLVIKRIKNI